MDKKKELKKSSDSHHFMDKLLTKLKMGKHGGDEKVNGSCENGKKLKASDSSSTSSVASKPLITWESGKLTPDNIMEFSDQLHQFLAYVQTLKDVVFCTNEYPHTLSQKLEKEAIELRNLFRDIRTAAIDIERLKKQRHLLKKEKCVATKKLDKLKEDEIKELESIICAYAKPLHSKWETIKNTQKPDVLENFMNEVTGKHRAIEILQELVRRRLCKISKKSATTPFTLKKNISSTNMNNKCKNSDKNGWNITPFLDIDKFSQNVDKVVVRGTPDRDVIRINRRKRQKEIREERRRQNADANNNSTATNVTTTSANSGTENGGSLDLQLVPLENFLTEEVDDVVKESSVTATPRTTPIINIEYTSDDDSVSMSSSDFTIENFVQRGNAEMQTDLQHEMQSVLQALFGEIRHIPEMGNFNTRDRHSNSGNNLRSPRTASH